MCDSGMWKMMADAERWVMSEFEDKHTAGRSTQAACACFVAVELTARCSVGDAPSPMSYSKPSRGATCSSQVRKIFTLKQPWAFSITSNSIRSHRIEADEAINYSYFVGANPQWWEFVVWQLDWQHFRWQRCAVLRQGTKAAATRPVLSGEKLYLSEPHF